MLISYLTWSYRVAGWGEEDESWLPSPIKVATYCCRRKRKLQDAKATRYVRAMVRHRRWTPRMCQYLTKYRRLNLEPSTTTMYYYSAHS